MCPHHCGDNFFSQSNINFDKAGKAEQEKRFMNQCCSIWFDEDIHECFVKRSRHLYEGFIKLLPLQELKEINSGSFFVQTATSQQQDKETKKIKRKKRVFRQRTNKDSNQPTNQPTSCSSYNQPTFRSQTKNIKKEEKGIPAKDNL